MKDFTQMMKIISIFGFGALMVSAANAASNLPPPPANCASRFVGTWHHPGFMGGNTEVLTADGRAICTENIGCQQGTWTCTGNVATYQNGAGTWNYTLISPNQMQLEGRGTIVDRVVTAPSEQLSTIDKVLAGRRRTNAGLDDAPAPAARPTVPNAETKSDEASKKPKRCYTTDYVQHDSCQTSDEIAIQITNLDCQDKITVHACIAVRKGRAACSDYSIPVGASAIHYACHGLASYSVVRR